MVLELYADPPSSHCRVVQLTLEYLKLPYELKHVNIRQGKHMEPEFLKLNPQHSVPVLKHDEFVLNEARAIAQYLANTFDKNGDLYPKEPKSRAIVDQFMFFDMDRFYKSLANCVYPVMFHNTEVPSDALEKLKEVLAWMENFVKETGFVARTKSLTIADISMSATYATMAATGVVDVTPYENLTRWYKQVKDNIPNFEAVNEAPAKVYGDFYKSKANK